MANESARIVYIIRRESDAARHYTGITTDVRSRLNWHNTGPSGCTVHHRPWSLVVSIEIADAAAAGRFERYLKSGSGCAFSRRHFGPI